MPSRVRSLVAVAPSFAVLSAAVAWQNRTDSGADKSGPLRSRGPTYWKGNLHTHSLWSDGDDFPEMIADWYKRHGYHFLTLTDHNVLSEGRALDRDQAAHKAARLALTNTAPASAMPGSSGDQGEQQGRQDDFRRAGAPQAAGASFAASWRSRANIC